MPGKSDENWIVEKGQPFEAALFLILQTFHERFGVDQTGAGDGAVKALPGTKAPAILTKPPKGDLERRF